MTSEVSLVVVIVTDSTSPLYEEIINIKEKIHELVDYTIKFDTINTCEEFVRSVRYEHIVLIVTSDMIYKVFEQNIHQIRHVQSIFLLDPKVTMHSGSLYELIRMSYKVCIEFILVKLERNILSRSCLH